MLSADLIYILSANFAENHTTGSEESRPLFGNLDPFQTGTFEEQLLEQVCLERGFSLARKIARTVIYVWTVLLPEQL